MRVSFSAHNTFPLKDGTLATSLKRHELKEISLMDRIERLPRPTALRLRSSVVVSSVPQILSELAQNAIDAGAARIECWIDLSRGNESVRVEDDGHGLDGGTMQSVGERNSTSLCLQRLTPQ